MATKGGGAVQPLNTARTVAPGSMLGSYFSRPGWQYFQQAPSIHPPTSPQVPPVGQPPAQPSPNAVPISTAVANLQRLVPGGGNAITPDGLMFVSAYPTPGSDLNGKCGILVNVNMTHETPSYPNVQVMNFPLPDAYITQADYDRAVQAANFAVGAIRAGKRTLINCRAGINRSCLVAGLALIRLGYTGMDAYNLLRSKRPGCLANLSFRQVVQNGGRMI